jgi:hypothetical protein
MQRAYQDRWWICWDIHTLKFCFFFVCSLHTASLYRVPYPVSEEQ